MKTAVEFLLSHMWTSDWVNYTREEKLKVIEQAKEMEKQQERDACGLALSKLLYKQALKSEISNEEIERGAKEWYEKEGAYNPSEIAIKTWGYAIKWYREQLKNKL